MAADREASVTVGLPPGLRWPAIAQTLAMVFCNEAFGWVLERRFDRVMTLRFVGLGEMVVVTDPAIVREVFTGDPEVLRAGEGIAPMLGRPVGSSSVMVLDGEDHLRTRRLLLPAFHGEAVRGYRDLVAEVTAAEIGRWPVGRPFALHPSMQTIALEVILRAVIGVRDDARRAALRAALARVAKVNVAVLALEARFPRLADGPLGRRLPWLRARHRADALYREEIAAHRADPEGRDDILAAPIAARDEDGRALSDAELRDQLATLLVAGQETTAAALAWCFERLLRHPRVLARLRAEIAAGESEEYLDAVVSEVLRARPVVEGAFPRRLSEPLEIAGYRLPAGTVIAPSILGVHYSDAYADPEQFRPERFLEAPHAPYGHIPFGGGTRRCLGASFALMEMKTVVRTVLERVELRPARRRDERVIRSRSITTAPARGARVVVG